MKNKSKTSKTDQIKLKYEQELTKLNCLINEIRLERNSLETELNLIKGSKSWLITKPLRFFSRLIRYGLTHQDQKKLIQIINYCCHQLLLLTKIKYFFSIIKIWWQAFQRAVSFYGSPYLAIQQGFNVLLRDGFIGVKRKVNILTIGLNQFDNPIQTENNILYGDIPAINIVFSPKVSIIVPNFNHADYLTQRLNSIYHQTYQNFEVILLDDCSNDGSIEILTDFAKQYPDKTICNFSKTNSGSVFFQWKKGLELASGELIWIAESDDFCTENMLEELVRFFQNQAVMLAFARTDFIRGTTSPIKIWGLEEYLADLELNIWKYPFIKSAHDLVKSGWVVKNLIPNVSSALFRHPGKLALFDDEQWLKLRLCGDWVFYLSIIRGGLVGYSPKATNYYRRHDANTSVKIQKENLYYQEHAQVARYLIKLFQIDWSDLEKQTNHLYQYWRSKHGNKQLTKFKQLYNVDKSWLQTINRKPNLAMVTYALIAGGGETFPIMLANLLHDRGYAITFFNCKGEPTEAGVRGMISSSIPLLELERLDTTGAVFSDMGIERVHSHHAWVDITLATLLMNHKTIKQIISMHGMYEMMTKAQLQTLIPILNNRIDCFVYTAEKNLQPFSQEFRQQKYFCKIDNALAITDISPIPRTELGLDSSDFVLCMVARSIPEKGWEEAIEAVVWANTYSQRKIHLLLIGEGDEYDRLKPKVSDDCIHFLGFRSNIRDYFAASDMGFLPSRFKGESFPLVLIDCLHSGKPMLASDIGEIRIMLSLDKGLAGEVFALEDWSIPIETVGKLILKLANEPNYYQELLQRVPQAAAKFDPDRMVDKYEAVYQQVQQVN